VKNPLHLKKKHNQQMTRKTPNIVLMEYSLRGVLDTLFAPKIQQLLFNNVVGGIQKAIKENKKELVICDINQLETSIAISNINFTSALKASLEYFVKLEDYSKCSQINKLIQELENGQRIKK
jgi:hypothetical protein